MLVREDFERNNFTKLGRVTGLGRGAKSLKFSWKENFAIFTRSSRGRREDWWKSVAPSPSRNKSRVGFRKISVERTAVQGIGQRFSLLASYSISTFYRNPTPPLFFEPPPGPRYFPFPIPLAPFSSTFHLSFPRDPFDHSPIMLR